MATLLVCFHRFKTVGSSLALIFRTTFLVNLQSCQLFHQRFVYNLTTPPHLHWLPPSLSKPLSFHLDYCYIPLHDFLLQSFLQQQEGFCNNISQILLLLCSKYLNGSPSGAGTEVRVLTLAHNKALDLTSPPDLIFPLALSCSLYSQPHWSFWNISSILIL